MSIVIHHLTPEDSLMEALSSMFGEAFGDLDTYTGNLAKCRLPSATAKAVTPPLLWPL